MFIYPWNHYYNREWTYNCPLESFPEPPFYFLSFFPMLPPVSPGNHWSAVYYKFQTIIWKFFHVLYQLFILLLSGIPLYGYNTVCYYAQLLMDRHQGDIDIWAATENKDSFMNFTSFPFWVSFSSFFLFLFFLPYCTGMDVWFLKCFFFFTCLCWHNHEVFILNFVIWWIDQYSNTEARLYSWDKCLLVICYLFDGFSLLKC